MDVDLKFYGILSILVFMTYPYITMSKSIIAYMGVRKKPPRKGVLFVFPAHRAPPGKQPASTLRRLASHLTTMANIFQS